MKLQLTKTQAQVLELISRGLLQKQVAARLGVAPKTVYYHLRMIKRQNNLQSVYQAVALAVASGQIPAPAFPCSSGPSTLKRTGTPSTPCQS